MTESYWWRTAKPTVFKIGGRKIDIDTKGFAYAAQFGRLTGWLGTHGLSGLMTAYESGILEEGDDQSTATALISYLLQYGVTPEAMIELGAILLNVETEFVEKHFDPGWMIDALIVLLDNKPGIKDAFVRLWERFFLAGRSDSAVEEDQAPD